MICEVRQGFSVTMTTDQRMEVFARQGRWGEGGSQEEERTCVPVCDRRGHGEYLGYTVHPMLHAERTDRLDSPSSIQTLP